MLNISKRDNSATFTDHKFTHDELEELIQYKHLVSISLINCLVTNYELEYIGKLPKLVNLEIDNAEITDEGLRYLANCPLYMLQLTNNKLTGEGFKYLNENKKLECIWLINTQLTNDGLMYLAQLPKLEILRIEKANVTGDGLMSVAANPRLKIVSESCFTKEELEKFENRQRELAKKKKTTNPQDIAEAKALLQAFFDAYTEWERFAGDSENPFGAASQEKYKKILTTFCSDKRLKEGQKASSLSRNNPYYTFSGCRIIDEEQITKNKIYFYIKNQIDFDYRLLLVRSDNGWKVESYQGKNGGWSKAYF